MTKITNLELTSQHGPKSFIARMGLEDKVIKLKASHSASNVARILNEKHPKENGNLWTKEDVRTSYASIRLGVRILLQPTLLFVMR